MDEQESPLVENVRSRNQRLLTILNKEPLIHSAIDASLSTTAGLASIYTVKHTENMTEVWIGLLWQVICKYQASSVELILRGDLDAGLALLRMASEVCRDVVVITKHPELMSIWKGRNERRNEYRKLFRFGTSASERSCHNLYEFASTWCVHRHVTALSRTGSNLTKDGDGAVAYFESDETAAFGALDIWFTSVFSLHAPILDAIEARTNLDPNVITIFRELVTDLGPLVKDLKKRGTRTSGRNLH